MYLGSLLTCFSILVYLVSPWLHLMFISPSFSFPFPLWAATVNICVFRITFPSGEEWSVKSNLSNTRPPIHNFSGCNYANDRSFSDLYPSACMDGGLPLWQPAFFCFCATYNYVTAGDPALKCWSVWKTAWLFVRLFLLPSIFTFVYASVSVILIILISVSLLPLLFSPLYLLFGLFVSLRFLSIRYSPKAQSWTNPAFLFWLMPSFKCSETCLRWLALTHKQPWSHRHTYRHTHSMGPHSAGSCCWNLQCHQF